MLINKTRARLTKLAAIPTFLFGTTIILNSSLTEVIAILNPSKHTEIMVISILNPVIGINVEYKN